MKLDTTTVLVLLFVLSRCKRRGAGGAGGAAGTGNWTPEPDPEGYNVPVMPLPANPLATPEEG